MRRRLRLVQKDKSSKTNENKALVPSPIVKKATSLTLQRRAFQLKTAGYSNPEIADELGVAYHEVTSLLFDGLEEYKTKRDEAAQQFLTVAMARYEALHKKWFPRAMGRTEIVKDEDGQDIELHHEPDPEAYRLVTAAMRDAARMLGLQKLRVEHTGADGGMIRTGVEIDWTRLSDEQLEKIQRGDFTVLRALAGGFAGQGVSGNSSAEADEAGKPPQTH